ncbi:unnamed protein product [Gadus morhua 'NCC']
MSVLFPQRLMGSVVPLVGDGVREGLGSRNLKRSTTQWAVSRASGSWSQHSMIVEHRTPIPCGPQDTRVRGAEKREHYYNAEDGSGYLAWRIKTLQKEASEGRPKRSRQSQTGGPRYDDMLAIIPRFMDIPGLIDQDFRLLFGDSTSAKLLEKWSTNIKPKVIAQSRDLTQTEEVKYLTQNAVATEVEGGWDSDMSSLLLLVH